MTCGANEWQRLTFNLQRGDAKQLLGNPLGSGIGIN